jgi:hypothetical protein
MDHSEDKDAKPPALPQQQQQPEDVAHQQQWSRSERARYAPQQPYLAHQNPYQQQPQQQGTAMAAGLPTSTFPVTSEAALPPYQQRQQQQQQQQQPHQPVMYQPPYPGYAGHAHQQYPPQQPIYYQQQQHAPPHQQPVGPPAGMQHAPYQPPIPAHSFIQPKVGRVPGDRPLIKLSVSLIDTYKNINTVYYEERDARRAARAKEKGKAGTNNNGWDDENYDYIVTQGELFYGRYKIKERIGKGSFGQVVRAEDIETKREVAIKIIKSKKPFLLQAKTEIELLTHLFEKDPEDQHNVGTYVHCALGSL